MSTDLESTTLVQRLALRVLVELDERGETPANPVAVRNRCEVHAADLAADVLGTPREVEVVRALNELAATGLVSESHGDASATGKGRPVYRPGVEPDDVLDALDDDERLASVVGRVREARSR